MWVHADSFLCCVASPFHSFVTTEQNRGLQVLHPLRVMLTALPTIHLHLKAALQQSSCSLSTCTQQAHIIGTWLWLWIICMPPECLSPPLLYSCPALLSTYMHLQVV